MRKLSIIGLAISMTFILSACSKQAQAETIPTTAMETTVSETTTEAETTEATTISETTVADMGNYGEYGKEAYELLKLNWMNFLYTDENELRREAESMLQMEPGDENLEIIIQELLSLDRPNSTSQETTQSESLTVPTSVESTKAPQPQPTPAPQPEPQQTTPAPAETQSQVNNTPPAAISMEEELAIIDQAAKDLGMGEEVDASTKVTISDGITFGPNAGEGYNWH